MKTALELTLAKIFETKSTATDTVTVADVANAFYGVMKTTTDAEYREFAEYTLGELRDHHDAYEAIDQIERMIDNMEIDERFDINSEVDGETLEDIGAVKRERKNVQMPIGDMLKAAMQNS